MLLTDEQWKAIEPHLPTEERSPPRKQGGRPWADARQVLDGVLWVLRTGAPWADLPRRFPPYQTCHRRFQRWSTTGVMPKLLAALRRDLEKRGGVENVEAFIDGTYVPAKKGGPASAAVALGTRRNSWRLQTAMVFRSLSILTEETDSTAFSPSELSMLLSYENCLLD